MLIVPLPACVNRSVLRRSSADSNRMRRARLATVRPNGVSSVRLPMRSSSRVPRSSSSRRMLRLNADCVRCTLGRAAERTGLGHGQQVLKLLEVHVQV